MFENLQEDKFLAQNLFQDKKRILIASSFILLVILLPLLIYLATHPQIFRSKASLEEGNIRFSQNGQDITSSIQNQAPPGDVQITVIDVEWGE